MSEHSGRWEIDTAKILPEVFKYTTIVLSELLLPRVTLPTWQNSAFPAKSTELDCGRHPVLPPYKPNGGSKSGLSPFVMRMEPNWRAILVSRL